MRGMMESLHQILQGGDPSLVTRMFVLENKLKDIETARVGNRDWLLKVAATLTTATIMRWPACSWCSIAGAKTPLVKP